MKTVCLVDDHAVVRHGMRLIVEHEEDLHVIGEAATCAEGLALAEQLDPDLMLVDVSLPDGNGIDLVREIRSRSRARPIMLVISSHDPNPYRALAIAAGASGYLNKDEAAHTIVDAIHCVLAGRLFTGAAHRDCSHWFG